MSIDSELNILEIATSDFDASVLPMDARQVGTTAFETAIRQFYKEQLSKVVESYTVDTGADKIRVTWRTKDLRPNAVDEAISALKAGDYKSGVLMLEFLAPSHEDDAVVQFNLGMAYSELGKVQEAVIHLKKAIELNPQHTNAKVALGVAFSRQEKWEEAAEIFEVAAREEPNNPWALRNLGGALLRLGGPTEVALVCLKEATVLLPDDQQAWFGLGQAQIEAGDTTSADESLRRAIEIQPFSTIAELAKEHRSKIATSTFRKVGGDLRMDAVMYCLSALKCFAPMPAEQVQQIGFEIAVLGTKGIQVNDPNNAYELKSMPGTYTGLHLLCLEYTAFQQIDPSLDLEFDVSREYQEAKRMFAAGM